MLSPLAACEVEGRVSLVAEDAVHRGVVRHPLGCVMFIRGSDGGLFILVRVVRGAWGNLRHFELNLQWAVSGGLEWHVVVLRPRHLDVCRICVAEVDTWVCRARLRGSM